MIRTIATCRVTHVTGNPETNLTYALRLRAREAVNAFLVSHVSLIPKSHKTPAVRRQVFGRQKLLRATHD